MRFFTLSVLLAALTLIHALPGPLSVKAASPQAKNPITGRPNQQGSQPPKADWLNKLVKSVMYEELRSSLFALFQVTNFIKHRPKGPSVVLPQKTSKDKPLLDTTGICIGKLGKAGGGSGKCEDMTGTIHHPSPKMYLQGNVETFSEE